MTKAAKVAPLTNRIPLEEEVDYFGLTDVGKVRSGNQDHFLVASLHKVMRLLATSLPDREQEQLTSHPYAGLMMVADGVGGHAAGDRASGTALDTVTRYLTQTMERFCNCDVTREREFLDQLNEAVSRSHEKVLAEAEREVGHRGMATTLTLVYVVWPCAYVIHVGDSRCYQLREGELRQLTRDQTIAQDMVDRGILPQEKAEASRYSDVLSSAIGGPAARPVITKFDLQWDDVLLLCTDGLTKHLSDEDIQQQLAGRRTAEVACRNLVSLALDRGGTDNVTVVVVRLKQS